MNKILGFLKYRFSGEYLLTNNTGTDLELFYLVFSVLILLTVIALTILIKIKKNRLKIYRPFDKLWFWGFLTEGLLGLFIWFSRNQALSIFSTRIISYLWIFSVIGLSLYLIYYLNKIIPQQAEKYYEKKRKEKYLKR